MLTSPASTSVAVPLTMPVTASGPVKILVVDSDAALREAAKIALQERFCCEIADADSSQNAQNDIARMRSEEGTSDNGDESGFNVIFLENDLPDGSGIDLLTKLRLQGDATPVVIMADAGREEIAIEAMRRGACDYIVKTGDFVPFFPDIVSHVIERDRMRRYYSRLEAEHVRFARLAAVGEMSAGIAHEIRNPMQVISGMATLMRDELDGMTAEEVRQCARAIAENCAHLQRILEDVLHEAQPNIGREKLLLSEVVNETIAFMRFDKDFRRYAVVECDFEGPDLIEGSHDHIKQVLINLLRNAAQAIAISGRESGPICISTHEDREHNELILCIQDSGDGIDSSILPRIFESGFSTKQRTRNRQHSGQDGAHASTLDGSTLDAAPVAVSEIQGSGLGLHICRRLIEAHGGRIWAQDTRNSHAHHFKSNPLVAGCSHSSHAPQMTGALFCIAFPLGQKNY